MVLRFDRAGTVRTVPLVHPESPAYEEYSPVRLRVRLLDRANVRALGYAARALTAGPAAGTPEGDAAEMAYAREVLMATLVGVAGVVWGDQELNTVTDQATLIQALDECGLLTLAALAAVTAQSPRANQLFC